MLSDASHVWSCSVENSTSQHTRLSSETLLERPRRLKYVEWLPKEFATSRCIKQIQIRTVISFLVCVGLYPNQTLFVYNSTENLLALSTKAEEQDNVSSAAVPFKNYNVHSMTVIQSCYLYATTIHCLQNKIAILLCEAIQPKEALLCLNVHLTSIMSLYPPPPLKQVSKVSGIPGKSIDLFRNLELGHT